MNDATSPHETGTRERLYAGNLSAQELIDYERALSMEGLAEEIALLRVRLKAALEAEKPDPRLLTSVMNSLVRAVAAQHRLSPKARRDLADNIAALLDGVGDLLLPADR